MEKFTWQSCFSKSIPAILRLSDASIADNMPRTQPNIIVTGTPGVGKTCHCETLAQNTGLQHLSINQIVKDRGCHQGWDDEYKSWVVDEDKVRWMIFDGILLFEAKSCPAVGFP